MLGLLCFAHANPVAADQGQDEDFRIYTDHPRIFLSPQRLKLLRRERERASLRWQSFEALLASNAALPEQGFAKALAYRVSGDSRAGRQAVEWALGPATDLRQLALVFDWCQELLSETESRALASKLQAGIEQSRNDTGIAAVRSQVLAATALAGHLSGLSASELRNAVHGWWEARILPALKSGRLVIRSGDACALFEILHVIRDNLNVDLREAVPDYFKNLPIDRISSYYPGIFRGPEGEFRIPASHHQGEPDFRAAALARAAELSMVAYDADFAESQTLQGWLMHDRFMMKGAFGAPYEFLWANPYQPGLSYYHLPLVYHDKEYGRLFLRSDWEDNAEWLGFFDGELQRFRDGKVTRSGPPFDTAPISLGGAIVLFENGAAGFKVAGNGEDEKAFIIGLKPETKFTVKMEHSGAFEGRTDPGGILELDLPHRAETGIRLREAGK